jgi:prevent-host-death family protein
MINTMSLKDLRPGLPKVIKRIDDRLDRYVITKRGKPVVVMLSIDDYESLMETLDILADPKAMAGLKAGEADVRQGKTRSWEDVKRSLGKLST